MLRIRFSDTALRDCFYAMPRVSAISLILPISVVQGIYAKHYGMDLATIAGIILFVRLLDTITDPLIGYLSDKYRVTSGTRKPFMILGAAILILSGYFLYTPPDTVSTLYFTFWFTLIFIGYTLFEIPHMAWGGEISHNSHDKTQTYNLRAAAGYSGLVLFYGLPLLPIWDTPEITPETLHFSAIVSSLLMLPLLYFCMKQVPNGTSYSGKNIAKSSIHNSNAFKETANSVIQNGPLMLFLIAFLFAGMALGMWMGLLFIFVDVYLGKGELFAEIYLITSVFGVASAWLWIYLAKKVGKKNTWSLAMLVGIACFTCSGFLSPANVSYWSLLILFTLKALCFVCLESIPQSMLSDIVDYTTLKFRIYRGGTYFSLFMFFYKVALALGTALGLAIAGWYGFDPAASSHADGGIFGLTLAVTWIPSILALIAIIFIFLSPITERRHRIIRRRLDVWEARSLRQNQQEGESDPTVQDLALVTSNN